MKKVILNDAYYRWIMLVMALASLIVGILQIV